MAVIVGPNAVSSAAQRRGSGDRNGRRSLAVWVCLATAMVVTACSNVPSGSPGPDSPPASLPRVSVGASDSRAGELRALTAVGVVDGITKAGFPAPDPRDATPRDCPDIGCEQSIVTDTVSVMSFATTGKAELYAVPLGLYQVATVVVSFAPAVPESEQSRYVAQIQKLVR